MKISLSNFFISTGRIKKFVSHAISLIMMMMVRDGIKVRPKDDIVEQKETCKLNASK